MKSEITIKITKEGEGIAFDFQSSCSPVFLYEGIMALAKSLPSICEKASCNEGHKKGIIMAFITKLEEYLGITKENKEEEIEKIKNDLIAQVKKHINA